MIAGPEDTEPTVPAPSTPPSAQPPTPGSPPSAPLPTPAAVPTSMSAFGGNESCPNCGARMAPDQRYCLNCGHRRGDPRLPFMDAVVFMETMSAPGGGAGGSAPPPPPPGEKEPGRMNANAALIAGVATLVLAIGVGFLIGRTGNNDGNGAQAQSPPIKVIEVGGGGAETATEATTGGEEAQAKEGGKESGKNGGEKSAIKQEKTAKTTAKAEKNSKEGANGQAESVEKVLHSTVPQAKSEVKVGESCEEGTAGCSKGGEFTGNFFGE